MENAKFGIVDKMRKKRDYSYYEPQKNNSVEISMSYLNNWWSQLSLLKTYNHSLKHPSYGIDRSDVTLIPPESLHQFEEIILSNGVVDGDEKLAELDNLVKRSIEEGKYIIRYY